MTSYPRDGRSAWFLRLKTRVRRLKIEVSGFSNLLKDMEKNEASEESFGIEIVLPDGDKPAPCCPHGQFKCADSK